MNTLATVLRYELLFLLLALVALVAYRMITQQINVTGLLMDKTSGRAISPGRIQLLMSTIGLAAYYLFLVFDTKNTRRLPDLPNQLVVAFGASHSIYLLGKIYGRFATTLGSASPKVQERAKPKEKETNQ